MNRLRLAALALIAAACAHAQVAQKANAHYATAEQRSTLEQGMADPSRDLREKPRELVASLAIAPGATVADVGTGPGYMLPFLSEAVGPQGRVLAEDIYPDFLEAARRRAEAAHLGNVTLTLGTETDPKLPAHSMDLVFLLDVYHHLNYPGSMLAHLGESLKDGGRLAIVRLLPPSRRDALRRCARAHSRRSASGDPRSGGRRFPPGFETRPHSQQPVRPRVSKSARGGRTALTQAGVHHRCTQHRAQQHRQSV